MVVRGETQTPGIHYNETFLPVIKMATVCILVAIATKQTWPLFNYALINNAFLHGDLDEDIYIPSTRHAFTIQSSL